MREMAEQIADAIDDGEINCPKDLNFVLSRSHRNDLIRLQNRNYNFLKHADIDAYDVLNEAELDNIGVIQHAVVTYSQLFPDQSTLPMFAFAVFRAWQLGVGLDEEMGEVLARIEGMGEREGKAMLAAFCEATIDEDVATNS